MGHGSGGAELAQPVAWRGDRHPAHLGVGVAAAGHPRRGGGQDSPGAGHGREDALAAARLLEVGGTTETPRRRTFSPRRTRRSRSFYCYFFSVSLWLIFISP